MQKEITNQGMIELTIGIQSASKIGNAKFKYALMLNEDELSNKIKKLKIVFSDLLKPYIDEYKKETCVDEKMIMTLYGLISLQCLTDTETMKRIREKYKELFDKADEIMQDKISVDLHCVTVENLPDEIDYVTLKQLKEMVIEK